MNKKIIAIGIVVLFLLINVEAISAVDTKKWSSNKKSFFQGAVNSNSNDETWTIMVYLDGDNNLEESHIRDFLDIANIDQDVFDLDITVQLDRIPGEDNSYEDWASCKRFYITEEITPTSENAAEDLGEANMGDPETLIDFVKWSIDNYPNENYCLILNDHGGGWLGICQDETNNNDILNMSDLKTAMGEISNYLIQNGDADGKLDILINDACYMGMIEVYYQLKDYVNLIISTESGAYNNEETDTFPLSQIIKVFGYGLADSPEWIARYIVNEICSNNVFCAHMNKIDDVVNNINYLTQKLINNMPSKTVLKRAEEDSRIAEKPPYIHDLYLCTEIFSQSSEPEIKNAAQDLMLSIDEAIIDKNVECYLYGIGICFPSSNSKQIFENLEYETLDFAEDTQWDDFLQEYFSQSVQRRCFSLLQKITDSFPLLERLFPQLQHFLTLPAFQ